MKEDYETHAQAQLASLKRDMRKSLEDATVRAVNKVMAEFEANSDQRLMENAKGYFERIKLVQTGVGIGKPEQEPVALPEKIYEFVLTPEPAKWHHPECEGECIACLIEQVVQKAYGSQGLGYLQRHLTSPPARKPLTHEQRVDLLAKFEPHKHEWHAPAILIDMVEAAHGIKGDA